MKFSMGQLLATDDICAKSQENPEFSEFVGECFVRYSEADWGDTCEEDRKLDDYAMAHGDRILAVYIFPPTGEKIWIITEADRSCTTALFPYEY